MKKVFLLLFLGLFVFSYNAYGRLSYSEWVKIKKEFTKKIDRKEKDALEALKEVEGHDDPQVAEMVAKKALFHSNPFVALKAFEVLKGYQKEDTIDKMADLAKKAYLDEEKIQYLLLMGYYGNKDKVASLLKNSLRERDWRQVSATLRSIGRGKVSSALSVVKRTLKNSKDSHPRLAFEAAWVIGALTGSRPSEYEEGADYLYPKKIFSKRVAFLVGTSLSMDEKVAIPADLKEEKPFKKRKEKYATKLELVQFALKKTLSRLDRNTYFNVIGFNERAKKWKREAEKATPSNLSSAQSFVERLRTGSGFDVYGALKKAFEDKNLDTIFLICDSLPRGGYYDTPEKAYKVILTMSRPRFVTTRITTLLSSAGSGASEVEKAKRAKENKAIGQYYKELARTNYGAYSEEKFSPLSSGTSTGNTAKKKVQPFEIKKEKGHISYDEWRRVKKAFDESFYNRQDRDRTKEIVEKVAAADDPRCADLIISKILDGDDINLIEVALRGLGRCSGAETLREIYTKWSRTSNKTLKLLLVRAFGSNKDERVEKALMSEVRGRDWRQISVAVQALKNVGTSRSLSSLKSLLKKKNRRLAYEAAEAVEKITGSRPEGFETAGSSSFIPPSPDSSSVLFAISLSDSMKTYVEVDAELYKKVIGKEFKDKKKKPKVTQKALVIYHLKEALEKLPSGTEFGIVLFSSRVSFYKSKLSRNSSYGVKKAIDFVEKTSPRYGRNLERLYREVRKIRDLDTLYLITDGLPEGGYESDIDKIANKISVDNLSDFLRIHCRVVLSSASAEGDSVEQARVKTANKKVLDYYKSLAMRNMGTFSTLSYPKARD